MMLIRFTLRKPRAEARGYTDAAKTRRERTSSARKMQEITEKYLNSMFFPRTLLI